MVMVGESRLCVAVTSVFEKCCFSSPKLFFLQEIIYVETREQSGFELVEENLLSRTLKDILSDMLRKPLEACMLKLSLILVALCVQQSGQRDDNVHKYVRVSSGGYKETIIIFSRCRRGPTRRRTRLSGRRFDRQRGRKQENH